MKISEDLLQNDVPARGQLKNSDCVCFYGQENADRKIAFLGNSITRHGRAEALGWYGDWGMAASCRENDYVHRLVSRLEGDGERVFYCVANFSDWERTRERSLFETRYAEVFRFRADTAVIRLGENADLPKHFQEFSQCYAELAARLAESGARVILTDLFWEYEPFDLFVKELATKRGYTFVQLHDLGAREDMKAIGKFVHAGVAAHPGDEGMAQIAARLYAAIKGQDKE